MNQNNSLEARVTVLEQQEQQIISAINQISSVFQELQTKITNLEIKINDLAGRELPQKNFDDSITGSIRNLQQEINIIRKGLES